MILKPLLAAAVLAAGASVAQAQCASGNAAISPCVQTYGVPAVQPPRISNRLRSDDTRIRVKRPEIHDRMQNPNRDFMSRKRVGGRNIFFSGRDRDGNLVMGTCVGGRCQ